MVLSVVSVFGAGDDLTPKDITMAEDQVIYVDYCVDNITPAETTVGVVVDPVCEDFNGISGCQVGEDDLASTEFFASSTGDINTVGGAGCTEIMLETVNAQGKFYYTVNGQQKGATVVSETGSVYVPEFGVLGAVAVLGGAAAFMAKKRKEE